MGKTAIQFLAIGFQISTEGSGHTWSINSQQNQLTRWSNDPTANASGEAFYIRDEDSGELWTPTAQEACKACS